MWGLRAQPHWADGMELEEEPAEERKPGTQFPCFQSQMSRGGRGSEDRYADPLTSVKLTLL